MGRNPKFILLLLSFMLFCSKAKPPKTETVPPKLENKIILTIKDKKIEVEVARTEEERALGLMYRKNLDWNKGMIFIFNEETDTPFWMKNTYLPLNIAFINKNNVIIDILEMIPNQETILYAPTQKYQKALEMNRGWFFENGIRIGDTIYGIP